MPDSTREFVWRRSNQNCHYTHSNEKCHELRRYAHGKATFPTLDAGRLLCVALKDTAQLRSKASPARFWRIPAKTRSESTEARHIGSRLPGNPRITRKNLETLSLGVLARCGSFHCHTKRIIVRLNCLTHRQRSRCRRDRVLRNGAAALRD